MGRICAIVGCGNSNYRLNRWKKTFCESHQCNYGSASCTCPHPFTLHPFPTKLRDPQMRAKWIKAVNRENKKTGKNWTPSDDDRICSWHFVDGQLSEECPCPVNNLGYVTPEPNMRHPPPKDRPTLYTTECSELKVCRSSIARTTLKQMNTASGEPASKIRRTDMGPKKIGTHNGTFHCDEVMACFMLKQLPEYEDAEIIRTRDPKLLDSCDIVVDVGGIFNAETNRFDHHQRTFDETMHSLNNDNKWTTRLSSAGLVYFHFGLKVIAKLTGNKVEDSMTKITYNKVYENLMEEIDAGDNGISQTDGEPRFAISTTLGCRVSHLNPRWNEKTSEDDAMVRFRKAMQLVGGEFTDRVEFYTSGWWPARELVQNALDQRLQVDPSGQIMNLSEGGCPWKDHLLSLEEEQGLGPLIKFVLYTDQNNKWRVQCVPVNLGRFDNRLSLLKEWQGLRDEELSKISGIPGCIFVHANGFIGGNETYEGALEMAKRTLQQSGSPS